MTRLSPADFAALRDALVDAFDTVSRLEDLAREARNVGLARLAVGDGLDEIVSTLIRRAQTDLWLPALIAAAMKLKPENSALKHLRIEWEARHLLHSPDPYKALTLPGKMVLIDRVGLRAKLAALEQPNGSRVLVIDGAEKSGQTYSIHYISYLATMRETFSCVYIDLQTTPRNHSNQVDALTLGNAISDALLGSTYPPPEDKNLSTWIDKYCAWLVRSLARERDNNDRGMDWVVIDHFRKVATDNTALDLVAALAMRTYRDLQSVRLILLSYRDHEWLRARVVGSVEREEIPAIDNQQLVRFFSDLHADEAQRRGETVAPAELVKRIIASVGRVRADLPCAGACPLETMGRAAWDEVERIVRPPAVQDATEALVQAVLAGLAGNGSGGDAGGGHVAAE